MIDKRLISYFILLSIFFVPFFVRAGVGIPCLTSYRNQCAYEYGECKPNWTEGCDYCEVDTVEYECEFPGGTEYCGFAERCVILSPPEPSNCSNVGSESFVGCYLDYNSNPSVPFVRSDPTINFNWGYGSPDASLYEDYYSVKWEGDFTFLTTGSYTFYTETDDGVRLYIDGELVIDDWVDQPVKINSHELIIGAGVHRIKMEYYEKSGGAIARLWWELTTELDPPSIPIISGYNWAITGLNYLSTFTAEDNEDFNIRYGIDRSNPLDEVVDEWVPSSGYVSSGYSQDSSHIWLSQGDKIFAVLSQNEWGVNSDWGYKELTVYHPDPVLEAYPSSVNLGGNVTIDFDEVVEPNSLDWIGLYVANESSDFQYVDWVYTSTCTKTGGAPRSSGSCNFTMPNVAGDYNFRFFVNDSWEKLQTSNTVSVEDSGGANYDVTVSVLQSPGGSIQSSDAVINTKVCGSPCVREYPQGSTVTLQALPSSSYWMFNGWSGACTGPGYCTVSVDSDVVVNASFVPRLFFYTEQ